MKKPDECAVFCASALRSTKWYVNVDRNNPSVSTPLTPCLSHQVAKKRLEKARKQAAGEELKRQQTEEQLRQEYLLQPPMPWCDDDSDSDDSDAIDEDAVAAARIAAIDSSSRNLLGSKKSDAAQLLSPLTTELRPLAPPPPPRNKKKLAAPRRMPLIPVIQTNRVDKSVWWMRRWYDCYCIGEDGPPLAGEMVLRDAAPKAEANEGSQSLPTKLRALPEFHGALEPVLRVRKSHESDQTNTRLSDSNVHVTRAEACALEQMLSESRPSPRPAEGERIFDTHNLSPRPVLKRTASGRVAAGRFAPLRSDSSWQDMQSERTVMVRQQKASTTRLATVPSSASLVSIPSVAESSSSTSSTLPTLTQIVPRLRSPCSSHLAEVQEDEVDDDSNAQTARRLSQWGTRPNSQDLRPKRQPLHDMLSPRVPLATQANEHDAIVQVLQQQFQAIYAAAAETPAAFEQLLMPHMPVPSAALAQLVAAPDLGTGY